MVYPTESATLISCLVQKECIHEAQNIHYHTSFHAFVYVIAHLEKSSSLLSKVSTSKVHVKSYPPLQSHLSSNLQSPRTQKAAQLPRMVPSSVGQKPGEKTHSFICIEREANTGLRSPQRVVGKRNASSFFQGSNLRPLKIRFKSFPDQTPAQFLFNSSQVQLLWKTQM